VDECKPLLEGLILRQSLKGTILQPATRRHVNILLYLHFAITIADVSFTVLGRGLHSSTSQLNLSALYGIGGVRQGLCSPC